jgi:response regulator RpfG family c-di-GMP phosphodiesterase
MSAQPSVPPRASAPILVVDDEQVVLSSLRATLEREGYEVVACGSPLKALEVVRERPFAVIISDQRMPEMMGLDFLIACHKLQPNSSRILMTAVLSLPTIVEAINKGEIFRFIAKPWLREELTTTIKNAYQRFDLTVANERLQKETTSLNARLQEVNSSLEERVRDLATANSQLDVVNRELATNFDHSLDLCTRILSTFDPLLADQTKSLIAISAQMSATEHFSEDEKHALKTSARLCDLGLIGVNREMLRAFRTTPEKLSERELEILHNHPIYSQTLAAYVDNSPVLGETIRAHHEHFDGQGYPDGLAGQSIPWTARCLGVAVTFVECGLPKDQAIEHVLALSGTALDPEAVRLFLKVTQLLHLPRQVREVMLSDLRPGMVLANGIFSPHGMLLISEGQALSAPMIAKIQNHNFVSPISQRLLVYA